MGIATVVMAVMFLVGFHGNKIALSNFVRFLFLKAQKFLLQRKDMVSLVPRPHLARISLSRSVLGLVLGLGPRLGHG